MRASVSPSAQGMQVRKVFKTQSGHIGLRLATGDQAVAATFADAIAKGTNLVTKAASPPQARNEKAIIIRDISEDLTPERLASALVVEGIADASMIKFSRFKPTRAGDHSCVARMPSTLGRVLFKSAGRAVALAS